MNKLQSSTRREWKKVKTFLWMQNINTVQAIQLLIRTGKIPENYIRLNAVHFSVEIYVHFNYSRFCSSHSDHHDLGGPSVGFKSKIANFISFRFVNWNSWIMMHYFDKSVPFTKSNWHKLDFFLMDTMIYIFVVLRSSHMHKKKSTLFFFWLYALHTKVKNLCHHAHSKTNSYLNDLLCFRFFCFCCSMRIGFSF